MITAFGANNTEDNRMYAFGIAGPYVLNNTVETMREQVEECFKLAIKYNIPVYFQMDDCKQGFTFAEASRLAYGDEVNCVHTGKLDNKSYSHFYDDPDMCEWIAFPTGTQKWGGQNYGKLPRWIMDWTNPDDYDHVVGGFPCFNSASFLTWYDNQIQEGVVKPIIENLIKLKAQGKEFLFAGIATGWETMIPNYSSDAIITKGTTAAYSNVLESWEKTQYGMHAIYNLGYAHDTQIANDNTIGANTDKVKKGGTLTVAEKKRELLYGVIRTFIEHTCKLFTDAGISRHKVFSHCIAWSSQNGGDILGGDDVSKRDTFALPVSTAINSYCIPGWTLSDTTCPYNLDVVKVNVGTVIPGVDLFANVETYASNLGDSKATAQAYIEKFMGNNTKLIAFFGYEYEAGITETLGFPRDPDNYMNVVIREWLSHTILPNYSLYVRTTLPHV